MKITLILVALMAFGVAGCKTPPNRYNAGAPSPNYEIGSGEGSDIFLTDGNTTANPQGQWYLWRYKGITPTTP